MVNASVSLSVSHMATMAVSLEFSPGFKMGVILMPIAGLN